MKTIRVSIKEARLMCQQGEWIEFKGERVFKAAFPTIHWRPQPAIPESIQYAEVVVQ